MAVYALGWTALWWPSGQIILDISTDIFIPGKTAAFKSQLIAALQSRDLWSVICATDPTLESIQAQNPQALQEEVEEALRNCMGYRQSQKTTLATFLPQLIKQSSLTYMQNEQLSALVTAGNGVMIWDFISQQIDLRSGVVQDKLQVKYDNLKVSATDSVAYVSSQVDLKWFLYKHHALYNVATESGRREGIRSILRMLLNGPGNIATEAILALSQVDMFALADPLSADAWVTSRLDNYKRYGELLAGQGHAQHYQMYGDGDDAYLCIG